jgi:hypothetical protein
MAESNEMEGTWNGVHGWHIPASAWLLGVRPMGITVNWWLFTISPRMMRMLTSELQDLNNTCTISDINL